MKKIVLVLIAAAVMSFGLSQAMAFKPAVVFDMGGKFDKSFNEGIWNGTEKFRKETGIKYREFEVQQEAQREQFLRKLAQRGSDVVIAVGFAQAPALEKVAKEFPNTKFSIIDMVVDLPNVQSIVFKEHEGSFLVGALAAMKSGTAKVGFVGGMTIQMDTSAVIPTWADRAWDLSLRVLGTEGTIEQTSTSQGSGTRRLLGSIYTDGNNFTDDFEEHGVGDFNAEIRDFAGAIRGQNPPDVSPLDALTFMKLLDAIYLSAGTGEKIQIDNVS